MYRLRLPERLLLILTLATALPAAASSGLLTGELGRWLDTQVLPELSETLGKHPRFKGETIRLVTLAGGRPSDQTSRLHQAVEAHLTQQLLQGSGVRIAWGNTRPGSCDVMADPVYLLGVEIERAGSRYHKLNIGMIDLAESVWVSGINHSWRGRLTATESAALGQPVAGAPTGSVDSPIPVQASRDIARLMREHLRCAHPEGLDGPVYLAPGENTDEKRVLASLRSELATAPIVALTNEGDSADWVLQLTATDAGTPGPVQQFALLLVDADGNAAQQVATVYVSGARRSGRSAPATETIAGGYSPTLPLLLSSFRLDPAEREGICDSSRARTSQCAEVSFDLMSPAYLFVLSSSARRLKSTTCEGRLVEASAGERRYRLRVPPSADDRPDAGLYAIAMRDRKAARELSRHIRTGVCTRPLNRTERWLAELDELLARHANAIEWRAIHLNHTPDGVAQL